MSTTVSSSRPGKPQPGGPKADAPSAAPAGKPVSWKTPVLLAVFALVSLVFFGFLAPSQTASFGISTGGDFFQLPALEINAFAGGIVLSVVLMALAGYAVYLKTKNQPAPGWLAVTFIVIFVAAFLIWVVGGARTPAISLAGLIAGSVTLAVPLAQDTGQ